MGIAERTRDGLRCDVLRIATCLRLPEPDPDETPLLQALRARGIAARMAAWDDPDEPWSAPAPTVIRSTWNYIHAHERFLAWAATARPLWNPASVVRWNTHKGYLAELSASGHAVVPTRFYRRGEPAIPGGDLEGDVVIKPAVSAGSWQTRRFHDGQGAAARAFLAALLVERDAMVQAYVPSVEAYGERSLIWIDGAFTHAIRKSPRFSGGHEEVSATQPIAPDELRLAEAVLAPYAGELLYGRVDLARDDLGRPMIMELELVEPSLFLIQHPPALERLVAGIARRL